MACGQAGQFPKQAACVIRTKRRSALIWIIRNPVRRKELH